MTTQEFKNQIGKYLESKLRDLGFKGSGFHYSMDSHSFIFTIGFQANKYGGSFCVELGVHPKEITNNGFVDLDFRNLKYYQCEFRTRLARWGRWGKWWKYAESESKNLKVIDDVVLYITKYAMPIIDGLRKDSEILSRVRISDIKKGRIPIPNYQRGLRMMKTDLRLAWVLAVVLENSNSTKSLEFAKYALSHDKSPGTFFGTKDLIRIIESNKENSENYLRPTGMYDNNPGFWTRFSKIFKN